MRWRKMVVMLSYVAFTSLLMVRIEPKSGFGRRELTEPGPGKSGVLLK